MIQFVRHHFYQDSPQSRWIVNIPIVEEETLAVNSGVIVEMVQPRTVQAAGAPNQSMYLITFVQQEFRQIRSILSIDPGNEGTRHVQPVTLILPS
jgi:hypothetical protein